MRGELPVGLCRTRPGERGEQVLPRQVERLLHVRGLRRDRDDGVVLGQHQAELSVGAVAAEAVAGQPVLEPVALLPVGVVGVCLGLAGTSERPRRRDLHRRGGVDPLLGQELPVAPPAPLEEELAQPRDRVRRGEEPGESDLPAAALLPAERADPERVEQARPQVGKE